MKKLLAMGIFLLFTGLFFTLYATDHLFLHNGDSITIGSKSGDPVTVWVYSISSRSRVDWSGDTCSGKLIFTNSEGWKEISCGGSVVTITIKETGGTGTKDVPGDSDVVIRYDDSKDKELYIKHCDDSMRGKKCNVCGKTLNWS